MPVTPQDLRMASWMSLETAAIGCSRPAGPRRRVGPCQWKRGYSPVQAIGAAALASAMQRGVPLVVVDVRAAEERARGYIQGSRALVSPVEVELSGASRCTPLVFVCRQGQRTGRFASYFVRRGFVEVYELAGGMEAWCAQVGCRVRVAPSVGIGEAGVGVVPRGGGPEGCPGVSVLLLADGSYEQVACAVRSLSWQQLPWPWTLELRVAAATRGVFEAVASVPDPRLRVFQFAGGTTPETMRSVLLGPSRGALVAWIGPLELLRPDGLWGLMAGLEQLGELGLVVCGHEESDGALRVRRPWARRGTSPAGPVLADRVVLDAVGALQGPELMRRAMAAGYAAGWVDGALVLRTPAGGGAMADEPTGTGDSSSLIKRTAFFTAGGTRVERLGWVEAGGAMTEEDVAGDW